MYKFRDEVRVKQSVIVPAMKKRTRIVLAKTTDRLRIMGPAVTGKDMWLCRNYNADECPPLITLHATEIHAV